MKTHSSTVHEANKSFHCNTCVASFGNMADLNRHVTSVHEGKKPFQCKSCASTKLQSTKEKNPFTVRDLWFCFVKKGQLKSTLHQFMKEKSIFILFNAIFVILVFHKKAWWKRNYSISSWGKEVFSMEYLCCKSSCLDFHWQL